MSRKRYRSKKTSRGKSNIRFGGNQSRYKQVGNMVLTKPEMKYRDRNSHPIQQVYTVGSNGWSRVPFLYESAPGVYSDSSIVAVPQGDSEQSRIGRRVTVKLIMARISLWFPSAQNTDFPAIIDALRYIPTDGSNPVGGYSSTATHVNARKTTEGSGTNVTHQYPMKFTVRILMVVDKQSNGTNPILTDILTQDTNTPPTKWFRKLEFSKRFRVLMDKKKIINLQSTHLYETQASTDNLHKYQSNQIVECDLYSKVNLPVDFSSSTEDKSGIRQNNVLIYIMHDRVSNLGPNENGPFNQGQYLPVMFNTHARIRYSDN